MLDQAQLLPYVATYFVVYTLSKYNRIYVFVSTSLLQWPLCPELYFPLEMIRVNSSI